MATKARKPAEAKKPAPLKKALARPLVKPTLTKKEPLKPPQKIAPKPVKGAVKNLKLKQEKPVQNFTVTSPPSQRKNEPEPEPESSVSRERKMTRTLDPSESFLESMKLLQTAKAVNLDIETPEPRAVTPTEVRAPIIVAKPISFEIPLVKNLKPPPEVEDYDDDFESYESDFEECEESSAAEASDLEPSHHSSDDESSKSTKSSSTHAEVSLQQPSQSSEQQTPPVKVDFKIASSVRPDRIQTRGQIILSKISLDDLTYSLLELPPMKYDHMMGTYGQCKSMQVHCQTDSFVVDKAVETESYARSTKWTQTQSSVHAGEDVDESRNESEGSVDSLEQSLKFWKMSQRKYAGGALGRNQSVDSQQLKKFLQRSYFVIQQLQETNHRFIRPSPLPMGQGQAEIRPSNFEHLKETKLVKMMVANNTLITVHEVKDQRTLVCLWNVNAGNQMSCCVSWGQISCVDLPNLYTLIAGTKDGSLTMWNPLNEDKEQVKTSQIIRLSNDCLTKNGIIRRIKCSSTARLKVHCLHDNYLTIWILLQSGGGQSQNPAIICDLSYVAPTCHQLLTFVSGVRLNNTDDSVPVKTRFSKVLHCFDNVILQDNVLQKLITNEPCESDNQQRFVVTDLLMSGKTVSLVTDRSFVFHGFSATSERKTKLWLGGGISDMISSYTINDNRLTVTDSSGVKIVNFSSSGETVEEDLKVCLAQKFSRQSRKLIADSDGGYIFYTSDQKLRSLAVDKQVEFTLDDSLVEDFEIIRTNQTYDFLTLLLANGVIDVHKVAKISSS